MQGVLYRAKKTYLMNSSKNYTNMPIVFGLLLTDVYMFWLSLFVKIFFTDLLFKSNKGKQNILNHMKKIKDIHQKVSCYIIFTFTLDLAWPQKFHNTTNVRG